MLPILLRVPGKIVSCKILVKKNRLRLWKGDATLALYTYKMCEELEKEGIGKIIECIAGNNAKVC